MEFVLMIVVICIYIYCLVVFIKGFCLMFDIKWEDTISAKDELRRLRWEYIRENFDAGISSSGVQDGNIIYLRFTPDNFTLFPKGKYTLWYERDKRTVTLFKDYSCILTEYGDGESKKIATMVEHKFLDDDLNLKQ